MVNKKIFIFAAAIFFVLVFSGLVNAWLQKVTPGEPWAFDWSVGTYYWDNAVQLCDDTDKTGWKVVSINGGPLVWGFFNCDWTWGSREWFFDDSSSYHTSAYLECVDGDGDNYSKTNTFHGVCDWGAAKQLDCPGYDGDASVYPGAPENTVALCFDGLDNNCDGKTDYPNDPGCSSVAVCSPGTTQQCGTDVGECSLGSITCQSDGTWGSCVGAVEPVAESSINLCNDGKDNDCDNKIDFQEDDSCMLACTNSDGDIYSPEGGVCGVIDCNDLNKNTYPKALEICDGVDNQCVTESAFGYGQIDENPDDICDFIPTGKRCVNGNCIKPTLYWASDSQGQNAITTINDFKAGDIVYLVLENHPQQKEEYKFDLEIWEDDGLLGPSNDDDDMKTISNWWPLKVNEIGNKWISNWTIIQSNIDDADDDGSYPLKFYFQIKGFASQRGNIYNASGTNIGTWKKSKYDDTGGDGTLKVRWPLDIVVGTWEQTGVQLNAFPKGEFKMIINGVQFGNVGTWETTSIFPAKGDWKYDVYIYLSNAIINFGTFETTIKESDIVYTAQSSYLSAFLLGGYNPALCSNGNLDTGEIGIDCGGPCPIVCNSMPNNRLCTSSAQCQSNNCTDNTCQGIITPLTNTTSCLQYTLCSDAKTRIECDDADSCKISLGRCSWSNTTNSCNTYEIQVDDLGNNINCVYEEGASDNCDDGRLDYSLDLIPDSLAAGCEEKDPVSILCSAQTALPLENKFGILLTIVSIIGIYFLFYRKGKKW